MVNSAWGKSIKYKVKRPDDKSVGKGIVSR
jgi:hypothetical protein